MVSQRLKDLYLATAGRASAVSYCYVRAIGHRRWTGPSATGAPLRLHLGSGRTYIDRPGYVNIDVHPLYRKDVWLDVRLGLPFPAASVEAVYCSHMLEHLSESQALRLLRECRRVLRPGGGVRLVTPHLGKAIEAYVGRDDRYFSDFPDSRASIGGRFVNHMLCRDQHRLMFDFSFMSECLAAAGFTRPQECVPRHGDVFPEADLAAFEPETPATHNSLFVEARA